MPNTDATGSTVDALLEQHKLEREQVLRIAHSVSFRSAQMLQQLLLYLAEKSSTGEAGALKEYSIGVEALGRRSDFDPKVDPIVRVQMHRLRQKLREYYADEGARDPLALEIPKGHYLPTFQPKNAATLTEPEGQVESALPQKESAPLDLADALPPITDEDAAEEVIAPKPSSGRLFLVAVAAFSVGLLVALVCVHVFLKVNLPIWGFDRPADPVEAFWSQFLGKDPSPIIGYPDAVFLLDESNDLFRFRHGASDQRGALVNPDVTLQFAANPTLASKAGPLYYENGYTGTGELEGIGMLSALFAKMGLKPTVKCSRDITTADLKQHNVILLGSPFQNTAVAQLPVKGDLVFENPDAHRELWRARILNLNPSAHEQEKYQTERDATGTLKADYALVSIMQGVEPGLHIAILAGLDTTGTQAATSFVVSPDGAEKMGDVMSSLKRSTNHGFQALLKVDLEKGYQVLDTQMLTLHEIRQGALSSQSAKSNLSASLR